MPISVKDLRFIVSVWAKAQQLGWSESDISDVVEYLHESNYGYLPQ